MRHFPYPSAAAERFFAQKAERSKVSQGAVVSSARKSFSYDALNTELDLCDWGKPDLLSSGRNGSGTRVSLPCLLSCEPSLDLCALSYRSMAACLSEPNRRGSIQQENHRGFIRQLCVL